MTFRSPRWRMPWTAPCTPPRRCSCAPAPHFERPMPSEPMERGPAVTDPLDVLREPDGPIAPDPAFAARLRARVERALELPRGVRVSVATPDVRTPAGEHLATAAAVPAAA